ncbi:MAG: hypothetical protein M9894_14880 [Planctomycetes bacterium]|nr:hypothetical protein [Planctomycetota bacterium]
MIVDNTTPPAHRCEARNIDITAGARAYAEDERDQVPFVAFDDLRPAWGDHAHLFYRLPASFVADGRHRSWGAMPREWALAMTADREPGRVLLRFDVTMLATVRGDVFVGSLLVLLGPDGRAIDERCRGGVPLEFSDRADEVLSLLGGAVKPAMFGLAALNAGRAHVRALGPRRGRLVMRPPSG